MCNSNLSGSDSFTPFSIIIFVFKLVRVLFLLSFFAEFYFVVFFADMEVFPLEIVKYITNLAEFKCSLCGQIT